VAVVASSDANVTNGYSVTRALFFASSNDLYTQFGQAGDPEDVVIDLPDAHVRDASTVAPLDAVTHRYETRGTNVEVVGLTGHSAHRRDRHTGRLAGAHRCRPDPSLGAPPAGPSPATCSMKEA
jgi:sulfate permease, SulP family